MCLGMQLIGSNSIQHSTHLHLRCINQHKYVLRTKHPLVMVPSVGAALGCAGFELGTIQQNHKLSPSIELFPFAKSLGVHSGRRYIHNDNCTPSQSNHWVVQCKMCRGYVQRFALHIATLYFSLIFQGIFYKNCRTNAKAHTCRPGQLNA